MGILACLLIITWAILVVVDKNSIRSGSPTDFGWKANAWIIGIFFALIYLVISMSVGAVMLVKHLHWVK